MSNITRQKWGAATGYAAVILGAAAVFFERPWPDTSDGDVLVLFFESNREAILTQSVLFILSACFLLWFMGSLRDLLAAAEGESARVANIAFASGVTWVGANVLGQAPQLTLTLMSGSALDGSSAVLLNQLGFAMLTIANIPLVVLLAAVAVLAFRVAAMPAWLGWFSAVTAVGTLVLALSVIRPEGALAPQGWLVYVLYMLPVLWLVAMTTITIRRIGRKNGKRSGSEVHQIRNHSE
ncbi:MAG: hypothetical protein K0R33_4562 [Mycobacterium sp.]|nr:hypothetical protein [Mycobacterium sp.]